MCSCISARRRAYEDRRGQATVEAAFLIPIMFLLFLLLLQPGILLYDRLVMDAAAADACRMLATRSPDSGVDARAYEEAVRRHLGAIPQQENFHCHQDGCSWEIELEGDEHAPEVAVRISGHVRLLPLLDQGAHLLGAADGSGKVKLSVEASMPTQDSWVVSGASGLNPDAWIRKWQ